MSIIFVQSHMPFRISPTPVLPPPLSQSPRKASDLRKHSMPTTMPSIAVTPSSTLEEDAAENNEEIALNFTRPTIKMSPQRIIDERRRKSADPIEPIYSNM